MEKGELKPLTQILKIICVSLDGKMRMGEAYVGKHPHGLYGKPIL